MKLGISEILSLADKQKDIEDKVAVLRNNDSTVLRDIMIYTFHPSIEFVIPEGDMPKDSWKPNRYPDSEGVLYAECRKIYLFVKGGNDTIDPLKRERLWINFLENLAYDDALLMIKVKDKIMPYKSITPLLVNTAFPGLLPEEALSFKKSKSNKVISTVKKSSAPAVPIYYDKSGSQLTDDEVLRMMEEMNAAQAETVKFTDHIIEQSRKEILADEAKKESSVVPKVKKAMPKRGPNGKFLKKGEKV